ncbi:unnamed protein product [Closterium sp. NIES-54]
MVTTTTPRGQRVSICTCTRTGRHLATFTHRPGSSLYTLATEPPRVAASAQHHRLGHPSLPHLCGMHSRLLVSGLPRSLPPLPPWSAPPCLPCVEGRQCAAPHSSSFPLTSAPLQTLHMDVWGPARFNEQGRERYFLLVVDDYTRYTTVFPLRSKGEVLEVLIPWIRTVRLQLRERSGQDLSVVGLYSDRGGEFFSNLLRDICHGMGILQSFTLPDSPQQNEIAERRNGLVMELRVSLPETSPTLCWTGKVGDASLFRVWGSCAFVRDTSADKLSARAILCVFLGFVPDVPGWQFYHPTSRRLFPSQDVTFDESVPFYRLFPYHSSPPPPPLLILAPGPPPVDPLPPQSPALSGVSQVDPLPGSAPFEVAVGSGVGSGGAEPRGAEPGGAEPAGVETGGVGPGGAESEGAESGGAEPRATGVGGVGDAGAGGAGVTAGAGGAGGTAATGPGGARTRGTGAAGTGVVEGAGAGDPTEAGGTGAGGAGAAGVLGVPPSTGLTPPLLCPPPNQSQLSLQLASSLPTPSPYTEQSSGLRECCEPASRLVSPVRTARRVPRSRPPPVPGTHAMALRPSSVPLRVPLPPPPESSLPEVPDPESDRARAATPTVARLLATPVTDPSFEFAAASALVAELLDFAAASRLDNATPLVAEQEDFECLAGAVPHFASMLLAPEGDPDAPDIPTPRSCTEVITDPYSSQWQPAMDAEMASWKSSGTYVDKVPPHGANIGVDYFQTFSPTPKITTLRVFLHVAAQRDNELHSLDFSTALLQGSLHDEIWLCRPPCFTESFPAGTHWSQAPCEWHDTLRTTLAALGFAPATADPSLFIRTDTSSASTT